MDHRDDFLLRQIRALIEALLAAARGAPRAEIDAEVRAWAGLSLDLAARLPASALLSLTGQDPERGPERALLLGLGLAERAFAGGPEGPQARALITAALAARSELDGPDVRAILGRLEAGGDAPG